MDILEIIQTTVTDMTIISAITSTVFIIMLGFFCRKKGIFSAEVGKILSKVVLLNDMLNLLKYNMVLRTTFDNNIVLITLFMQSF